MFLIEEPKYKEEDIIIFNDGLPGFEIYKKYIIIKIDDFEPFKLLYCIDNKEFELKFVILDSKLIENYNFKINKIDKKDIKIENDEDILKFNIVTIDNTDLNNSTINLMGPIIINSKKRIGKQLFLDENKFNPKHYFLKKGV